MKAMKYARQNPQKNKIEKGDASAFIDGLGSKRSRLKVCMAPPLGRALGASGVSQLRHVRYLGCWSV